MGDIGPERKRRIMEPMPETAPAEEPLITPEVEPEAVPV